MIATVIVKKQELPEVIDIVELDEDKTYLRRVASSLRETYGADSLALNYSLTVD